jgi:hypothetical protein
MAASTSACGTKPAGAHDHAATGHGSAAQIVDQQSPTLRPVIGGGADDVGQAHHQSLDTLGIMGGQDEILGGAVGDGVGVDRAGQGGLGDGAGQGGAVDMGGGETDEARHTGGDGSFQQAHRQHAVDVQGGHRIAGGIHFADGGQMQHRVHAPTQFVQAVPPIHGDHFRPAGPGRRGGAAGDHAQMVTVRQQPGGQTPAHIAEAAGNEDFAHRCFSAQS